MIILGRDEPWPEEIRMDSAAGMRRPQQKSFAEVVANGVSKWMMKSMDRPTHLIIGFAARQQMRLSINYALTFPCDSDDSYMGLKVLVADKCGIELLGDLPP